MRPKPATAAVPLRKRRLPATLAHLISTICNPFLMALLLFVILAHAFAGDAPTFWKWLFLTTFFTVLAPILLTFWLYATERISDLDISVREERERVFGMFVGLYLAGTLVLYALHAPPMIVATMAGYTAAAGLMQYITRYWKISAHAVGITAPLVVLVALYGEQPLPFLLLIPIVGWARVYLKAHTLLQVCAGVALGFAAVYSFFKIFKLL